MPLKKLQKFLDGHHVKYSMITHSQAYTAQEIAASAHIPGKELAKTVIVKKDGELAMAVLPASQQIDFDLLRKATGAKQVQLSSEDDFRDRFEGCELGAMPPFGNLYEMEVYASKDLAEDEEIAFNAGSHTQLIKMGYQDFEALVKPQVIPLSSAS